MSRRREDPVNGGEGDRSNSSSNPPLDGAFLLQLLRRPPQVQPTAPPPPLSAAAAAGPNQSFAPHNFFRPPPPPEPYTDPLQFSSPTLPEFHRNPRPPPGFAPSDRPNSQIPVSRQFFGGDPAASSPSPASDLRRNSGYHSDRSFPGSRNFGSQGMGERNMPNPRPGYRNLDNGFATRRDFDVGSAGPSRGFRERNHSYSSGASRQETLPRSGMNDLRRPLGPQMQSKGPGELVASKGKANGTHGTEKGENHESKVHYQSSPSCREGDSLWRESPSSSYGNGGEVHTTRSLFSHRLDRSEDASVSTLHVVEGSDNEQGRNHSQHQFKRTLLEVLEQVKDGRVNEFADQLMDSLLHKDVSLIHMEASLDKKVTTHSDARRGKDLRSDSLRGNQMLSQRMRIRRRETRCRHDIESLAPRLLSIYESLVPAAEEKAKQKQLLMSLVKLVTKEWPNAQLHVYGSCANSFGFSNSDIDICLEIDDSDMSKSEILLKLADILQSDNLENVQALIHARVPIVKMMDPITGISCDICVNNLLAVVNTKLLRDYARIDERLRQLAFIVKHWAKSRRVNETYRGTLSSYAYVLMCIHFLQLRKPAILPCLQEMVATYTAVVEGAECAYFDQVEKLHNFGAGNSENIARLLWAFFHYWAYYHDYTNDVISVRTGRIISKQAKEWTRRIGIDRHLVCIEDPFETAHDLGRVVDKFSIKILREEFERAAYILQYDPNPSVTLFEPYVLEQH